MFFGPINNALLFLIRTIFDLYIFILVLRFILPWFNVSYYNAAVQFLLKCTDKPIKFLRRFIPRTRLLDLTVISFIMIVVIVKFIILIFIAHNTMPSLLGLGILTIADILEQTLNVFFYSIILVVILSWLQPQSYSPIIEIVFKLTEPLMRKVRRVIPAVGGFDLTPIPILLGLKLIEILFINPLFVLGMKTAILT